MVTCNVQLQYAVDSEVNVLSDWLYGYCISNKLSLTMVVLNSRDRQGHTVRYKILEEENFGEMAHCNN